MIRLLILTSIVVTLAYLDARMLLGLIVGLVYCIACGIIDDRKEGGDC